MDGLIFLDACLRGHKWINGLFLTHYNSVKNLHSPVF